jgi:hypothetical protein
LTFYFVTFDIHLRQVRIERKSILFNHVLNLWFACFGLAKGTIHILFYPYGPDFFVALQIRVAVDGKSNNSSVPVKSKLNGCFHDTNLNQVNLAHLGKAKRRNQNRDSMF